MSFVTCDLCDDHPDDVRVCEPMFASFGGRETFGGEIVTVKCHEDNSRVKELLATPGKGKVLMVDGGGSLRCALMGDLIGASAVQNGWEGVIIYGCVRDVDALAELDIGVHAVAAIPLKSVRKGVGETGLDITFGGITFVQGQYVYADNNGVITSPKKLV
ncbi:MAG: ribonuclease E activity regulator RraA [Moraxellaceae bacterium]|jgi:regulator of ribonuclease activity A|nr:ribonuclease E activity regulator RraA [Moraxellaceae bacterium]MCC6200187.1 ribonuclease E activity regulator RraA [Moraxellaceae bacterium]HQV41938.1 ribonuclease E activity regulator RraA [Moraxellaceae bacterium]HQX89914.1 ribonuclease E activity regulator RraA [Moraxellaceae bacterium]